MQAKYYIKLTLIAALLTTVAACASSRINVSPPDPIDMLFESLFQSGEDEYEGRWFYPFGKP